MSSKSLVSPPTLCLAMLISGEFIDNVLIGESSTGVVDPPVNWGMVKWFTEWSGEVEGDGVEWVVAGGE